MIHHRVLDEIFRSWSHVAVLRALIDAASGFSGNEIARISGMHPRSALKALTSLEDLGIVHRQRGGRDHIFTLNRKHILIQVAIVPLYNCERQFPDSMIIALGEVLKGHVATAIVFGSVARREETPKSDMDVCCIVRDEKRKNDVREILGVHSSRFHETFGVRISSLFFTVEEFRRKSKSQLVRGILKDGVLIVGKSPRVLLDD